MKSYLSVEQTVVPRDSFLESPETFRVHVVWQIFFVSSKPWRPEARNFVDILIFIPFTTYEKTSSTEIVEIEIDFSGLSRNGPQVCIFALATRIKFAMDNISHCASSEQNSLMWIILQPKRIRIKLILNAMNEKLSAWFTNIYKIVVEESKIKFFKEDVKCLL